MFYNSIEEISEPDYLATILAEDEPEDDPLFDDPDDEDEDDGLDYPADEE